MNKITYLAIINGSFSLLLLGQFVSQLGDAAYMVGLLGAARGFAYLRRTLWLRRLAGVSTVSNALTDPPGPCSCRPLSRKC